MQRRPESSRTRSAYDTINPRYLMPPDTNDSTPEPLEPGTTFWYREPSGDFVEVEIGGFVGDRQRWRHRLQDGNWQSGSESPGYLRRLGAWRVDPPDPIVYTLADIVRGVMAGRLCTEGLVVSVMGTNGVFADRDTDGESVELWSADNANDVLVELLTALGVPARRA